MSRIPSDFFSQIAAIWARLQTAQKATVVAFAALVLGGLGVLVFFMNQVEYVTLYRDLNPEDAQAIAARLKELKKDFHVSGDATAIEVAGSKTDVDKLRLEIAGSGLARSGRVGYEIFDKNQFGMTDFTEQVNYKRALEGELSRTISSLSEVAQARVHLVLPKDSLFEEKKEEAKASVLIRLRKGNDLSKASIGGIVNLVAGAVQGLRTNNVSVVDQNGRVLSRLSQGGDGLVSDVESGLRAQIEKELSAKVLSILEPVVGRGRVRANASVEIDFNSSEQTEETYNPNPPAVLSQQKSQESVKSGSLAAGIPGIRSNQTPAVAPDTLQAPSRSRTSELTNYEVSKMVRHTVQPKGTMRRISVAVILDHKPVYSKNKDGGTDIAYRPRTKQELAAYRELVMAAIGYDAERGDTVTLENIPFFTEVQPEEEVQPLPWHVKWRPYLIPGMKYLALILLFLLAYLVLLRPIRKRVYQSIAATAQIEDRSAGRKAVEGKKQEAIAGDENKQALPAAEREEEEDNIPFEEMIERDLMHQAEDAATGLRRYDIMKKRIAEHAKRDPEQVSQLIRSWIQEKA